jgi:hypothetical protein
MTAMLLTAATIGSGEIGRPMACRAARVVSGKVAR